MIIHSSIDLSRFWRNLISPFSMEIQSSTGTSVDLYRLQCHIYEESRLPALIFGSYRSAVFCQYGNEPSSSTVSAVAAYVLSHQEELSVM